MKRAPAATATNDRLASPVLHYGMLGVIYGLGAATLLIHTVGHALGIGDPVASAAPACQRLGSSYVVTVAATVTAPVQLAVGRCDRLQLHIASGHHLLAFGDPADRNKTTPYPGYKSAVAGAGQTVTVVLAKTGHYQLHDHLNPDLVLDLTVR